MADILTAIKKKWAFILGVVLLTTALAAAGGYFYTKNTDYTLDCGASEFLPIAFLKNQTYQEQLDTLYRSFYERKRYVSVLLKFSPDDANITLMQARQDLVYLQDNLLQKLDLKLKLNKAVPPAQKHERVQNLQLQIEDLKQKLRQSRTDLETMKTIAPPAPADKAGLQQYTRLLMSAAQKGKYELELNAHKSQLAYLTATPAEELERQNQVIGQELNSVRGELERISQCVYGEAVKIAEEKAWNIRAGYGVNSREREEYSVEVVTGHFEDTAKSQWVAITVTGMLMGFVLSCFGAIVLNQKEKTKQRNG